MPNIPFTVTLAAVAPVRDTALKILDSLGAFRFIFGFAICVIFCFLVRGWVVLWRNACPLDFDKELAPETMDTLRTLVRNGMDETPIRTRLFSGKGNPRTNLFFGYLLRFGRRDRTASTPAPSLLSCAAELSTVGKLQEITKTVRFLSSLLPAIGLLGTLAGMFIAFDGADFQKGAALAATMGDLMDKFALALWTTIVAVILKISVDLFCHFTVETHLNTLKSELARLRLLLLDLVEDRTVSPVPCEVSDAAGNPPVPRAEQVADNKPELGENGTSA